MPNGISKLLDDLEALKLDFQARRQSKLEATLDKLNASRFTDAAQLIRFHEILLFLRAYPRSSQFLQRSENILASFANRVRLLREQDIELFPLTQPQVSGISGAELTGVFTYNIARYLAHAYPSQVSIDWNEYDRGDQFALVMRRFLPLLEEDSYVETYYSCVEWLRAAMGRNKNDLVWIINRFERLQAPEREKGELFDSLKLWIRWQFHPSSDSRTNLRWPSNKTFYHDAPLIGRKEVSLASELEGPSMPIKKLKQTTGLRLLDKGRATMSMRYRELHGFTYGDSRQVWRADAGRGLEIFVWGVPPENRLPILAYHSVLIVKNEVPVGYAEALSLCERTEVGLNLFYTFRDGESAWIYARILKMLQQLLGITVFSVDPYQLGYLNSEGLKSGAFWFYRKLGFRPIDPELGKLVEAEERRIAARPGYRTPASRLAKLSSGHLLFEHPGSVPGWDSFHIRNIGLAVQRQMAARFGGDECRMRKACVALVVRALGIDTTNWGDSELNTLSNLALVLATLSDLEKWSPPEKLELVQLIRAKGAADELDYLNRMQRHPRLRAALIRVGSESQTD